MAFNTMAWPAGSLLPAQGRFLAQAILSWSCCLPFFVLIAAGARWKASVGVACGVAIFYSVTAVISLLVALYPAGLGWFAILNSVKTCLLNVCIAIAAAMAVTRLSLPSAYQNGWIAIFLITGIFTGIYLPLLRRFDPESWKEVETRFHSAVTWLRRIAEG
jgi:hypothetical protein